MCQLTVQYNCLYCEAKTGALIELNKLYLDDEIQQVNSTMMDTINGDNHNEYAAWK